MWALALMCAACGSKTDRPTSGSGSDVVPGSAVVMGSGLGSGAGPRLFTDAEIARLDTALTHRLDANARRTCIRPVLRGTASPGAATAELRAFVEATGDLAVSKTALEELRKLGDYNKAVQDRTAPVLGFERSYGDLLEQAVTRTVSHEDACSAYQAGVRPAPQFLFPLQVAKILALRADLRAEAGEVTGALRLLLDSTRVYQDLTRGHVNLVVSTVGTVAEETVIDHAQTILNLTRLSAGDTDSLVTATDKLLASEVPFGELLQGELDSASLFLGLPSLRPKDWTPPGGWDEELRSMHDNGPLMGTTIDRRDSGALILAMAESLATKLAAACSPKATLTTCHRGFAAIAKTDDAKSDATAIYAELANVALADDSREAIRIKVRDRVIAALEGPARAAYEIYPARRAATVARIASLRIHLEVERTLARTGRCPTRAELVTAPFATLAAPAALGDTLMLTWTPHSIEVSAPEWINHAKPKLPWLIRCP